MSCQANQLHSAWHLSSRQSRAANGSCENGQILPTEKGWAHNFCRQVFTECSQIGHRMSRKSVSYQVDGHQKSVIDTMWWHGGSVPIKNHLFHQFNINIFQHMLKQYCQ